MMNPAPSIGRQAISEATQTRNPRYLDMAALQSHTERVTFGSISR